MKRYCVWAVLPAAAIVMAVMVMPGVCLAQSGFASDFDHLTTGFRLDGAHLTADCEGCHVGGVFQGTPTQCSGCHVTGGRLAGATAKPVDHVLTTDFCEDCHRTYEWFPLLEMNHDAIVGSCSSCHNNVQGEGKPPDHLVTQLECDACHFTTAWFPASFDHAEVQGGCSGCHNGSTATGKDTAHFATQLECDHCHSRDFWSPIVFAHESAGYPGDHRVNLSCTDCHASNAQPVTWPFPAYAPDCAGCHASDYRPDPHRNASVSELRDCAGSCHQSEPEHRVNAREW